MNRKGLVAALVILTIPIGYGSPLRGSSSSSAKEKVTFNRDIAPIIFQNCSTCHRPGEAGPFPLLTYDDVKSHARQIAFVTRTGFMPPWLPAPGEFKFAEERRLTAHQISLIQRWVEQGAARGNAADLPPSPRFTEGWPLGPPEIILKAEKPFVLPAGGSDRYWNFVLRLPINETRWLKAIDIRPGDKRLVHHANVLVDRDGAALRMEKVPGAGFGGMEINLESETFDPDSHFLFWKPGSVPYTEPDGMALRLDAGNILLLNLHLQPSGKEELIEPRIGLYFTDQPASLHPMLLQLQNDRALDIPAGDANFIVNSDFTLPVDVDLLAIYPHAHYLGKDLLATATLPDGTRKTLIHIPQWDLNWQGVFRYAPPVRLPRGTTIAMRYVYDNSDENVANPNNPPARVTAGNRATDEMSHLWLQILPVAGSDVTDPRSLLMEALARRTLQNDPNDFEAHYNLAARLQARGDMVEAIQQYELALRIRSDHPAANNALGGALLANGETERAIASFNRALAARPDYFDAHYNLALALVSKGEFEAALVQFNAAAELDPQDSNVQANLGTALAQVGRSAEAKQHLEKALQLNPKNAQARENLDEVQRRLAPR
jgi:tetratricopeptide (TPR) repeat protein